MGWSVILWTLVGLAAVVAFFVGQLVYLSVVLSWEDRETRGLAYYGLPPEERSRFKKRLRRHALFLFPVLRLIGKLSKFTFERASFRHRGISGPRGTCSPESFARADRYEARPQDVFVVTQMKCGTTWMQHVVYEVLHRGQGALVDSGTALYAVSPWLESLKSVPVDDAPLVGQERASRIIKTHLPVELCPYSADSRYVYVTRHPASCFASCVDFIATNAGATAPGLDAVEAWFCSSELMWWGSWPAHVSGWWDRSRDSENVLFVHFEEMKKDLGGVAQRVADFLGLEPLAEQELEAIVHKCGFEYMQRFKETFEMQPPHLLQTDAELFVRGSVDRHRDVPPDVGARVLAWCAAEMDGSDYPLETQYPDVAAAKG